MQEIASLSPMYGGITYSKIEKEGVQWPCPTAGHPGTKFLHECEFSSGKGLFRAVEYIPPAEEPDANYPFMLMTGRSLYQFHTGTMSRRSKRLNWIHPEELMEIDPDDAKKLNLSDGDLAEVESRRGKITTRIKLSRKIPDGSVWMTFHFKESAANILTNTAVDPICHIPELKAAAIRIKKIEDRPREKVKYKH
jgi:predicted molibdopterin-dependent oxidoreductase YjgC